MTEGQSSYIQPFYLVVTEFVVKEVKLVTIIERDMCTPMFIAALFTIARTWKQPRCPLADEWIRKLWYIYTMEYYSGWGIHVHPWRIHVDLWQNQFNIVK